MGCPCDVNNPQSYIGCAGDIVRQIAPASVMMQFAAGAGASSSNYSMCLAMMFLYSRRIEYWKVAPGDCGSPGTAVIGTTFQVETGVTKGLGVAASVDPEPISKGILAGVAAIFGGFTAHHAQAVATEQSTLCGVSNSFNYMMNQLEPALLSGQVSAVNASAIMHNAVPALNASLNSIKSGQNAAWGYQIAMTALVNFCDQVVFPALEANSPNAKPTPAVNQNAVPVYQQPPPGPAMPQPVAITPITPELIGSPSPGMNANNMGVGPLSGSLPLSITPGTIVVIAGVAYLVGRV